MLIYKKKNKYSYQYFSDVLSYKNVCTTICSYLTVHKNKFNTS